MVDRSLVMVCAMALVGCGASIARPVQNEQPRLIAPYANGRLSVRAPTLRWLQARGEQRLTVCRTRACAAADVVWSAVVAGASARVPSELAPGRYYWRVEARAEGATRASATWSFQVPQRSAPVESVVGTYFDAEGDGRDDVVALTDARLSVLRGGQSLSWRLHDEALGSAFGVGDFDGDGLSDVGVAAACIVASSCARQASILRSSSDSNALRPTAILVDQRDSTSLSNAGDVDGDGYGDVIVATANEQSPQHEMFVAHGGPDGVSRTTPSTRIVISGGWVRSAAAAGDVDGDGFADIVATQSEEGAQVVSVYYGGADGIDGRRRSSARVASRAAFWPAVAGAGDVDGDGYADIVVGTPSAGAGVGGAWIGYGGPRDRALSRSTTVEATRADSRVGDAVNGVGDIDGDGYDDVAASGGPIWGAPSERGVLVLWRGGASGLSTGATLLGPREFGHGIAGPVDLDGDGLFDVVGHSIARDAVNAVGALVFRGRMGTMPLGEPEFVPVAGGSMAGWLG